MNQAKDYGKKAAKQEPPVSQTVARQRMYSFLLSVLATFYRDLMLCRSGAEPSVCIHADHQKLVKKAAAEITALDAGRAVRMISRAEYLILTNVNANLVFEDLFGDLVGLSCPSIRGTPRPAEIRK